MNSVPVFSLNDSGDDSIESNEEKEMSKEEKEDDSLTQGDEEDASQKEAPRNLKRASVSKSNSRNTLLEKTTAKIITQFRRLEEKRQMLQTKRNARLEDVKVLHKKILVTWIDVMNCQHEYNNQYIRSIETSQAVWHANSNSNHRPSSHDPSVSNRGERHATEKEAIQKQKVEQLARDLLAATDKRLKTLEEVNIMLTRELEDAKTECQMLDKELMEMTTRMLEMNDLLETLNDDGESEGDAEMSVKSGGSSAKKCNGNREVREYIVEKRSVTVHSKQTNPCTRNEGKIPR